MEVVGVGLVIDLGDPALLGPRRAGEVPEVVGGQGDVGGEGLAYRLAVLVALGDGEHLEVLLDRVGNRVEHRRALGRRLGAPGVLGRVGGVERQLHILRGAGCDLAEWLAGRRGQVLAVLVTGGGDPLAADEVVVAVLQRDDAVRLAGRGVGGAFDGRHGGAPVWWTGVIGPSQPGGGPASDRCRGSPA